MKVGLTISIDVTKIEKERLYKGAKGTYLNLTTFVDLVEKDRYDNNGFISQTVTKEERDAKVKTPILGNVKVIYVDGQQPAPQAAPQAAPQEPVTTEFDEELPF